MTFRSICELSVICGNKGIGKNERYYRLDPQIILTDRNSLGMTEETVVSTEAERPVVCRDYGCVSLVT